MMNDSESKTLQRCNASIFPPSVYPQAKAEPFNRFVDLDSKLEKVITGIFSGVGGSYHSAASQTFLKFLSAQTILKATANFVEFLG